MSNNRSNTEAPTCEHLGALGSIEALDPVPAAIAVLGAKRQVVADAEAAFEDARQRSVTGSDGPVRRRARRSLDEHRDALLDARDAQQLAERDLAAARQAAFNIAAPVLRAEFARRLPAVAAALRELNAAAAALQEVEDLARSYQVYGASLAPARSALASDAFGTQVVAKVQYFESWLERLGPSAAA